LLLLLSQFVVVLLISDGLGVAILCGIVAVVGALSLAILHGLVAAFPGYALLWRCLVVAWAYELPCRRVALLLCRLVVVSPCCTFDFLSSTLLIAAVSFFLS
jgi:hypothetical protein